MRLKNSRWTMVMVTTSAAAAVDLDVVLDLIMA